MRGMSHGAMSFSIPPIMLQPRNPALVHVEPNKRIDVAYRVAAAIEQIIREEAGVSQQLEADPPLCPGCSQILLSDVFDILGGVNGWRDMEHLRTEVGLAFMGLKDPEELR